MNTKESNNNINLILTDEERAILIGTLLGDAHIQKRGNSYRLKISHSINQKEYVHWKYAKLRRLCKTTQPPKTETIKSGFEVVTFYTSSGLWLKELHELFYVRKKQEIREGEGGEEGGYVKIVSPDLQKCLSTLPPALWLTLFYLDDGSVRNDCYSGKLSTQGFTLEENHFLRQILATLGIEASVAIHSKKKNQYYLNLRAITFGTLIKYIEPVVREIPVMIYKLNELRKPRND
jgi:hypothetical protein